jgi:catechol 2,3-dioxygenase-like lactoylglutathione lyase family enzyme
MLVGKISSLESVALEVRNPDIARHFYTEVLGMKLLSADRTGSSQGPMLLQPAGGGSCIMLCHMTDQQDSLVPGSAGAHPELRWTGLRLATDNVDAVFNNLSARNVRFLQDPQTKPWGVRDCVFCDPDGNVFNLVQQIPSQAHASL